MGTYELAISTTATEIVSVVPDNLKSATDTALGLCNDVKKEAKVISAMSQQQAEDYIQKKFHKSADKFLDWITGKLGIEIERSEVADEILGFDESENTFRLKKALADFKKVRTEGEKRGWKKLKELLKAVFGIIFAVFVEVAKVVLKLAFALTVGTIRVGCMALSALLSCVDVLRE